MRYLHVMLLAVVLMPLTALAQSDAEHQQFLFAYKLLQRGEVDEAAREFDEYLGKFPKGEKLGDAQYYRALLHRKAGDNVKAALLLRNAAKPTLVPPYAVDLLCGQAFTDERRYTDALASLEKIDIDKLEPKIAVSALYLKGLAYRGAQNLDAAATSLQDAAKLDTPMKARALLDLAKVRALLKDTDKARAALDQCLAVDDTAVTPEAARFAGDLAYNAGDYGKAMGYYHSVVSRHQTTTHFAPAVVGLMWAQFADKQYDDLIKTFDGAVDALPVSDRLPAIYLAGSAHQEKGDHLKAIELLSRVSGGEGKLPIQEKVLYKLALSLFETAKYQEMDRIATRLLKRFPDTQLRVDVAFLQATAQAKSGQVQAGADRLSQFIDRGPSTPYYQQALLRRAHLYETNSLIEPAAGDYQSYLNSVKTPSATSVQAGFRLMELLGALKEHDRVIALASGFLELADTNLRTAEAEQEALYRLAVAHRFKNELDKALAIHARLTRDHPINPYRGESILEQGLIYMTQDDPGRGVPMLLDAVKREELKPFSRFSALRIIAQHDEDNDNAQRAFELRIQMQQLAGTDQALSDDEALWMGDQLIKRDQAKEALQFLGGVESKEHKERAMLLTGRAQRMVDNLNDALKTLNEVRAISERYGVEAWLEIALVYRDQGKLDESLAELIPLQDPDRGHTIAARALYEAGLIHGGKFAELPRGPQAQEQADKAREAFKKLWLLYPDRKGEDLAKEAYLALAQLLLVNGDKEGEVKVLAELTEAYPESAYGAFARALLAQRANRLEQFDRELRQTIQKATDSNNPQLARMAEQLLRRER